MTIRFCAAALTLLLSTACAGRDAGPVLTDPIDLPPIVAERPATAGSLWTVNQGSFFTDVKARNVGDIVTVAIFERASASQEASTSTGRSSTASADLSRLFGLEKSIGSINSAIDPTALLSAGYNNQFKGSGSTVRKEDLVATLTTRVTDVFPNGTMRIEGSKMVMVNREKQIITLAGIVRQADITPQNIVDSKYILDARIGYTGKGVLSDKQGQGWLVRILDNVWPF